MKLNILKLLTGGQAVYSSIVNPVKAPALSTSTKSSSDGLISDKLLDSLSASGNPNDVLKFMTMLYEYETNAAKGLSVNKSALYGLRAYANLVIQLAKYLNSAEKRAEQNGSLDEVAVDLKGFMYVLNNEGKLKKVHSSLFKFNEDIPLTVAELIQARRFSPELTDNEDTTTAIGSSIGTEKILKYIQDMIDAVGSTEDTQEAYHSLASIIGMESAKKPTEKQQLAVRDLAQMANTMGLDAIFKTKDSVKSKNINEALEYIYSMLPNNMKTQLIAKNVAMGGEYSKSNKYAIDIISKALLSSNDVKTVHNIDFEKDVNQSAGTKAGEIKPQKANLGVLEQLAQGSLGKTLYHITSTSDPNLSMTLSGAGVGQLADFKNNLVPKVPLTEALERALGPLVDENHVTMGNQKIPPGAFDSIVYGGGNVVNIWAPTNAQGDVDLEALSRFNAVLDYIKANPEMSKELKLATLYNHGFTGTFDEQGNFVGDGSNMAQFLVFTGISSDEILDEKNNKFLEKLDDQDKDFELSQIERIYAKSNKGIKSRDARYKFKTGWFNATTDLFYAPIFMKLGKTAQIDAGTFSDHGPLVHTLTYQEQLGYDLARYNAETKPQIHKPSTALMFE